MKNYDILFFTDFEEGHVFPLFKLASNFEKSGFKVCFVGVTDTMNVVERNGFKFHVVLKELFPMGYVKNMKEKGIRTNSISKEQYMKAFIGELDVLMDVLDPKLVFMSTFFPLEALMIHYKYDVKLIFFVTTFPELKTDSTLSLGQLSYFAGVKVALELGKDLNEFFMQFLNEQNRLTDNYEDIVLPLKKVPHVLLCPKELNIHNPSPNGRDVYLGPGINPFKADDYGQFTASLRAKTNKKIIFASMGSQTKEYPEKALKFFNSILQGMKSDYLQDFHLVLSLGAKSDKWELEEIPENVSVFSWVPQLEVLENASLAITHGGLGSVKECIYFNVPMLVIPMGRDQMDNAQRVEHHNLGLAMKIDQVSRDVLIGKILELLDDDEIKRDLQKMNLLFRKAETSAREVLLAKTLIK